jgi:DtxR family transcriptional regulator, Mn-dependent transcriptional regulator
MAARKKSVGGTTTSTVEDYLKCVLMRESRIDQTPVPMGEIAGALDVAPGTVTAMMKALAESGLVSYEPYTGVRLTDSGRSLATHVLRRHRLIELFLVEMMGLDWSEVHAEAERLEHAVSDRLIERMDEMLGRPSVDPHGDPIPDAHGVLPEQDLTSMVTCAIGERLRIVRVRDQSADFLRHLERGGLMPGVEITVVERNEAADTLELEVAGREAPVSLGLRAGAKILVESLS